MKILILAAAQANSEALDGNYPLCLAELDGRPLIERLIENCNSVGDAKFIVALRELDIRRFHLDNIVALLAPGSSVVRVMENTRGAACTALLAASHIDNDEELLIINGNELLDEDFSKILYDFREKNLDAGVVTFPSVHPRYSYVRLNEHHMVVEAAEKRPISRHATVGFYWFARGNDFVRAVQNMIRKDACVNELFYICPALNELVLQQARIGIYGVEPSQYHPLKTERQLIQFENAIDQKNSHEPRKA